MFFIFHRSLSNSISKAWRWKSDDLGMLGNESVGDLHHVQHTLSMDSQKYVFIYLTQSALLTALFIM